MGMIRFPFLNFSTPSLNPFFFLFIYLGLDVVVVQATEAQEGPSWSQRPMAAAGMVTQNLGFRDKPERGLVLRLETGKGLGFRVTNQLG